MRRHNRATEDDYYDLLALISTYVSCAIDDGMLPDDPEDAAYEFCTNNRVNYSDFGGLVARTIRWEVAKYVND